MADNKIWVTLLCLCIAFSFVGGYEINVYTHGHVTPKVSVNVSWTFQLADGVTVTGHTGNLVTDIGDQFISNLTIGRTMSSFTYGTNGTFYIALGNQSTPATGDTQLLQEFPSSDTGFKRSAQLTPTFASGTGIGTGTYYNWTITNKFGATQNDCANATSIQWSGVPQSNNNELSEASIGTLPVGQAFGYRSATDFDNCSITYTLCIQH